jgi:hypothetical protein
MGRLVWLLSLLLFLSSCRSQPRLRVVAQETTPLLEAAARELGGQLEQVGFETEIAAGPEASAGEINAIILSVDESASDLPPEGFRISTLRASGFLLFRIVGKDARGILWGCQELAERIIAARRLESVSVEATTRRFPLRAIALPLPLPEASESLEVSEARADPREQWRVTVDLLARSRLNAIFLRTTQPAARFAEISEGESGSGASTAEIKAHREWLTNLFKMAEDRGLDCYLWLTRSSLEGRESPSGSAPSADGPRTAPGDAGHPLQPALTAILRPYPGLAGIALDSDVLTLAEPPERSRWIVENVLAPLAAVQEQRPIFLSAGPDWRPSREELSAVASDAPVYVLAELPPRAESPVASEYPVVWKAGDPPSSLRPWEDPGEVRAMLQRMAMPNAAGFLDVSFLDPRLERPRSSGGDAGEGNGVASLDDHWFRLLLWGRLGYSSDIPDQNWMEQFARRFGTRGGDSVYLAAAYSSRVLDLLPRDEHSATAAPEGLEAGGLPDSARQFLWQRRFLTQSEAGRSSGGIVAQAMTERGRLLPAAANPRAPLDRAAAVEEAARRALAEAATAERFGAWREPANEEFHQRIRSVAESGLAWAEYRRAAPAVARFLLDGKETERQQALQHLQTAQQLLAARIHSGSADRLRLLDRLRLSLAESVEMIPKLQPWPWEKTRWEVGMVEGWQPATPGDLPLPSEWTAAETTWLREFGPYGQQPWIASINQQLRSGFLSVPKESLLAPGTLLVGRTQIPIPAQGQLLIRVVSNGPGAVWVNRRRAIPMPPQQPLWNADTPPQPPLRLQLFAQLVAPGGAEVVVSAPANPANEPLLMLHSFFVPATRNTILLNAPDAADLAGGVAFVPGTEAAPQPRLTLREPPDGASAPTSRAAFRFSVAEPGFYRIRLWCRWETSQRARFDIFLDGSPWQPAVGREDPVAQQWHWVAADTAADLGPGEHLLAITGWTPGSQLGIVEILQQGGQQDAGTGRE